MKKWSMVKLAHLIFWSLAILGLVLSMAYVSGEEKAQQCRDVEIRIMPELETHFADRDDVAKLINGSGNMAALVGKPMRTLDVSDIERNLETSPYIRNAEVFADLDGSLRIEVEQKKPILRVFMQHSKGFYIDADGHKMPLSTKYSARVLTVTGHVKEVYGQTDSLKMDQTEDLYRLALFISEDDFWSKQIQGIYIRQNGDFELLPLVGDQIILFGGVDRMEEKFKNLWLFYRKAMNLVGWDTYKVINLKYSGQVVCEK
ncbi:MAG: hypothetical protein EP332_01810 [Bacteroidetes bacterium]|nr:MAG: hypothetical protein EP332_01810 [Bacteroidota bacterium]